MYTTMGFGREIGVKVIYLDHGMNIFAQGFRRSFINQKSVTYICHGYDHRHIYGSDLPNHSKPPRPVIGNPATVVMNSVRGKRVAPPRNRVLFSNYTLDTRTIVADFTIVTVICAISCWWRVALSRSERKLAIVPTMLKILNMLTSSFKNQVWRGRS